MTLQASNYPTIRPTLDLQFAATRTLSPLITFTRSSSGTYVDADGVLKTAANDVPRFDHNPRTGESLGLLVEEQRTNLLTFSENVNNWGLVSATITTDQGIAPNGTLTADRVESTGGGVYRAGQAVVNATAYTYSVFLKHVSGTGIVNTVGFERFGATPLAAQSSFNVQTGAIVSNGASVAASSITAFGNGWYRVTVTAISTDTTTTVINYASTPGNQFLIWGAQLEAGAFPTSYIPTTTATVTRSADVASISGSNFSGWYRQDEGTVFAEGRRDGTSDGRFIGIDAGSISNSYVLTVSSLRNGSVSTVSGGAFGNGVTTLNSFAYQASIRIATSISSSQDEVISLNGGTAATGTTTTPIGTLTNLTIGTQAGATTAFFNGTIRRLTYFPQRLPNNVLQEITR